MVTIYNTRILLHDIMKLKHTRLQVTMHTHKEILRD